MFALTEQLLLGADLYFAESGLTIDAGTVAINSKPDNDPTTNWTDREFGCINRVKHNVVKKTETRECGRGLGNGGYQEELIERIVRDEFEFTTLEYNEIFHRLAFGLTANPTPGTEQDPFKDRKRQIDGWMRMVLYKEPGVELCTVEIWSRISLGEVPEWKNETGSPVYKVQFIGSGIADLDSVLFPA